jgi:hypothetical protein
MEAIMKTDRLRMAVYSAVYLIFSTVGINAEYIEGIDTTTYNRDTINGSLLYYGLDSSFAIWEWRIFGDYMIFFGNTGLEGGYFNCSFDDLKVVPDTTRENNGNKGLFIIRNIKDSTYSKVQVIKRMEDGRYIYKYGTNTVPNNKLLIDSGYDHLVKYKPNNLYNWANGRSNDPGIPYYYPKYDSLYWEPPIQNNNHLLGYILYASKSKGGVGIDTAKPIDTAQWDSVAFFPDSTKKAELSIGLNGSYINLVALYEEGKSEFLDGWTMLNVVPVGVARPESVFTPVQKKVSITAVPGGVSISAPFLLSSEPFSISLFNPNGSLHSRISGIKGNRAFLSTSGNDFAKGLYLLRAEFPDRSVITQPFTITR